MVLSLLRDELRLLYAFFKCLLKYSSHGLTCSATRGLPLFHQVHALTCPYACDSVIFLDADTLVN